MNNTSSGSGGTESFQEVLLSLEFKYVYDVILFIFCVIYSYPSDTPSLYFHGLSPP